MQDYFFDSSGIVKRYVLETGSTWLKAIVDPAQGNSIHVAWITGVEVISALVRREQNGSISPADGVRMRADFRHDFANDFRKVAITPSLLSRAMGLAEVYALRAFDAVQLAAALEVHAECLALGLSFTLVSADTVLNAAALTEGLTVEDPNNHP